VGFRAAALGLDGYDAAPATMALEEGFRRFITAEATIRNRWEEPFPIILLLFQTTTTMTKTRIASRVPTTELMFAAAVVVELEASKRLPHDLRVSTNIPP
jgi:hypothetical protein